MSGRAAAFWIQTGKSRARERRADVAGSKWAGMEGKVLQKTGERKGADICGTQKPDERSPEWQ